MRRWRPLVLATGFCGLVGWSASAQTLTEEQALTRMRMEHPLIRVLQLTVHELAADGRERSLLANPTVSYTREDAGLGVDDFLLVTQELPVRRRRRLLREAAEQAVNAAEARTDADLLAFETRLRLAFTDLLLAQERTQTLETTLSDLNRLVDVLRAREEQGEGSRFDRLRAERELVDIDTDLGTVDIDRLTAQARLASFFAPGTEPAGLTAAGRLAEGTTVPDIDALLMQALVRRPDYRALALSETQWATEKRAAERLRLPGVAVTAGLKRTGAPTVRESGYVVTATVAVPLFNRGQAQVARAEAARGRTDAERQALRARIDSEVRIAHAAASRYRQLVDRYRAGSVERAAELAAIATAAYEEGEYGILELLDAHRATLRAGLRLLELSAAARRAEIELDRAIGQETRP
jgi:cobalt-zinc-cadmium efflux system outer membrane protein